MERKGDGVVIQDKSWEKRFYAERFYDLRVSLDNLASNLSALTADVEVYSEYYDSKRELDMAAMAIQQATIWLSFAWDKNPLLRDN